MTGHNSPGLPFSMGQPCHTSVPWWQCHLHSDTGHAFPSAVLGAVPPQAAQETCSLLSDRTAWCCSELSSLKSFETQEDSRKQRDASPSSARYTPMVLLSALQDMQICLEMKASCPESTTDKPRFLAERCLLWSGVPGLWEGCVVSLQAHTARLPIWGNWLGDGGSWVLSGLTWISMGEGVCASSFQGGVSLLCLELCEQGWRSLTFLWRPRDPCSTGKAPASKVGRWGDLR